MKKSKFALVVFAGLIAAAFVGCSSSPKETAESDSMTVTQEESAVDTDSLNLGASSAGRAH